MVRPISRSASAAAALGLAACMAACATTPIHNASLQSEHQALAQARQDPAVRQYGSAALTDAEQSLAAADRAAKDGNAAQLNHQLFMADRAIATARARGQAGSDRARLASLNQERDQALLQAKNMQLEHTKRELQAYRTRQTSQGTVVTLYNLPFATGKATLRPGAEARLQPLMAYLKDHPDRRIIVQGNTDSTGTAEINQRLSKERADAVRNYLIGLGVAPDRIIARGLGSSFPVASNDTAAGRQENRRVDVVIEPPSSTAALPEGAPNPH